MRGFCFDFSLDKFGAIFLSWKQLSVWNLKTRRNDWCGCNVWFENVELSDQNEILESLLFTTVRSWSSSLKSANCHKQEAKQTTSNGHNIDEAPTIPNLPPGTTNNSPTPPHKINAPNTINAVLITLVSSVGYQFMRWGLILAGELENSSCKFRKDLTFFFPVVASCRQKFK